jgi:flagellar biosynthesis protein FliP
MPITDSLITTLAALLLFTAFVKVTTALTVFRYGVGLTGLEFGVVTLVVAFGVALGTTPPELGKLGFPAAFFTAPVKSDPNEIVQALAPYMKARLDPSLEKTFADVAAAKGGTETPPPELQSVLPVFVLSEMKSALTVGCYLLIPFVVIDLIAAHLLALVGINALAAQVVSLPMKLLLFLAVDGWSLLVKKLLGV